MKFFGLLILSVFLTCAPAYAQVPALKHLSVLDLSNQIARQTERVLLAPGQLRDLSRFSPLLKKYAAPLNVSAKPYIPPSIRRSVFTVQATADSKHKGSAFAVNIDGRVWGVTARHVMDDIGHTPYITVPDQNGNPITLLATPSKQGSAAGADVALFEIPPQALEFLRPLELADELPPIYGVLSSSGFARGHFLSQPEREVLFASRYRILTKYVSFHSQGNGYCGSPLLFNGKVAGVHVGSLLADKHGTAAWFPLTLGKFNTPVHDVSVAVPAGWLRTLARQAAGETAPGAALLFNGLEIGRMLPSDHINFIMQLREGRVLKTIPRYPFMDYEHLENFFDAADGDIFRMEINQTGPAGIGRRTVWYEWDNAGRITKTIKK